VQIIDCFVNHNLLSNYDKYCEKLKNRIKRNLIPIVPGRQFPRNFKHTRRKINRKAL